MSDVRCMIVLTKCRQSNDLSSVAVSIWSAAILNHVDTNVRRAEREADGDGRKTGAVGRSTVGGTIPDRDRESGVASDGCVIGIRGACEVAVVGV